MTRSATKPTASPLIKSMLHASLASTEPTAEALAVADEIMARIAAGHGPDTIREALARAAEIGFARGRWAWVQVRGKSDGD